MTTLITGGSGFVGAELTRLLVERGERPILLDVSPLRGPLEELKDHFDYVRGSVGNLPEVLNVLAPRNVKRIFHLAGMLSLPSEENPWAAFNVNAVGTYNILEAARLFNVGTLILSSSIAVYSEDLPGNEITETTLSRPKTMYGACKVFGELLGRFYSRRFGLDFRGIRLPSVVGPFSTAVHMSSYNCWAIEEPLRGRDYVLPVEPATRVPAIYYKDAARALLLLAEADKKSISTMVYNLAGIVPAYTAQQLVDAVLRRIPGAQLSFDPDAHVMALLKEIGQMEISEKSARQEWGWDISYNLDGMIDDFINEFNRRDSDMSTSNRGL
ncbi:MAG: NAD-dependent epimerase/dehydratase family protein [Desulfomonile tiedjei]|uniref:NAD-dependent epimerase/dehydratase family protein n=1 Tax=Desulfomonile tiedjei TaxID=2358 RepID=A0A9D6UYF3_9BACT|nr:NAD-dependent epimerase/dehydratase family protein [Desulfomonile tiedjei]